MKEDAIALFARMHPLVPQGNLRTDEWEELVGENGQFLDETCAPGGSWSCAFTCWLLTQAAHASPESPPFALLGRNEAEAASSFAYQSFRLGLHLRKLRGSQVEPAPLVDVCELRSHGCCVRVSSNSSCQYHRTFEERLHDVVRSSIADFVDALDKALASQALDGETTAILEVGGSYRVYVMELTNRITRALIEPKSHNRRNGPKAVALFRYLQTRQVENNTRVCTRLYGDVQCMQKAIKAVETAVEVAENAPLLEMSSWVQEQGHFLRALVDGLHAPAALAGKRAAMELLQQISKYMVARPGESLDPRHAPKILFMLRSSSADLIRALESACEESQQAARKIVEFGNASGVEASTNLGSIRRPKHVGGPRWTLYPVRSYYPYRAPRLEQALLLALANGVLPMRLVSLSQAISLLEVAHTELKDHVSQHLKSAPPEPPAPKLRSRSRDVTPPRLSSFKKLRVERPLSCAGPECSDGDTILAPLRAPTRDVRSSIGRVKLFTDPKVLLHPYIDLLRMLADWLLRLEAPTFQGVHEGATDVRELEWKSLLSGLTGRGKRSVFMEHHPKGVEGALQAILKISKWLDDSPPALCQFYVYRGNKNTPRVLRLSFAAKLWLVEDLRRIATTLDNYTLEQARGVFYYRRETYFDMLDSYRRETFAQTSPKDA